MWRAVVTCGLKTQALCSFLSSFIQRMFLCPLPRQVSVERYCYVYEYRSPAAPHLFSLLLWCSYYFLICFHSCESRQATLLSQNFKKIQFKQWAGRPFLSLSIQVWWSIRGYRDNSGWRPAAPVFVSAPLCLSVQCLGVSFFRPHFFLKWKYKFLLVWFATYSVFL